MFVVRIRSRLVSGRIDGSWEEFLYSMSSRIEILDLTPLAAPQYARLWQPL